MALSEGKVQRIDALIRAGLHKGAGIYGLLELHDRALKGLYSQRTIQRKSYCGALHTSGLMVPVPQNSHTELSGLSTVRRNTAITPLSASPLIQTKAEIQRNIRSAFENASVGENYGYVLMIDEIKIEERVRWDPQQIIS